jgi:hypothetical protein
LAKRKQIDLGAFEREAIQKAQGRPRLIEVQPADLFLLGQKQQIATHFLQANFSRRAAKMLGKVDHTKQIGALRYPILHDHHHDGE